MYYEKTGDAQAREDAFRSLNYSTYFTDDEGKIACCGLDYADSYWFDDGYGDHIRHYLWAMGAIPELAPLGQNHLLRSSSVVKKVMARPDNTGRNAGRPVALTLQQPTGPGESVPL